MASALIEAMWRPSELCSLVHFQFLGGKNKVMPKNDLSKASESLRRCYELLNLTSRSFAAVIQALDIELRPAITIFYLALRALDTVEDDMTLDPDLKHKLLTEFHLKLAEPGWIFKGSGPNEKDALLLWDFDKVIEEHMALKPEYQEVIADITKRMGAGMAEYITKKSETMADYNLYCHYVAGLVGIGLSKLFSATGLEDPGIGKDEHRSNSMGLFLQKTNIIRDFLEDLDDGRTWYPCEVWSKYAPKLDDLRGKERPENRAKALGCLNEMVTDALQHIPDVFSYLSALKTQSVFNFCAIPQVMAIATLAMCFDNYDVFKGVVKIRKGVAVQMMMAATDMNAVYSIFDHHLAVMKSKLRDDDGSLPLTQASIAKVDNLLADVRGDGRWTGNPTSAISANQPLRWIVYGAVGILAWQVANGMQLVGPTTKQ